MLVTEQLVDYKTKLREVVSAGEPLKPEVIDQGKAAWGITIRDGYGQTENTAIAGNSPAQTVEPASVGTPMPGFRLTLLDLNEQRTHEGELCVALDPPPLALLPGYQHYD